MPPAHDLILLDLDGTISDPLVGIGRSINYALEYFGHEPRELTQLAAYIGPPIDQTFRALTGVQSIIELHAYVDRYRERYAEQGYAENTLYPGIREALSALHATGVPLAVCTSKRVDFAVKILQMFDLRDCLEFVDGGEVGVHKWQQIEGLLARGKVSSASVMVGDRGVDLIAAHRNGLQAAGVLWGYGSRKELEFERPNYLLATPAELACLARANLSLETCTSS